MLRLITSGVFDRYPNLQIAVGHMGEALPFWLFRLDYMHRADVRSKRYERIKPLQEDDLRLYARERLHHHQRHGLGAGDQVQPARCSARIG